MANRKHLILIHRQTKCAVLLWPRWQPVVLFRSDQENLLFSLFVDIVGTERLLWFIFYLNFLIPNGDYEWHCAQESLLSAPRELISRFVQRATEKLRKKK